MNLCDYNRTATIEAAKIALIKGTNIEDSQEEMKVLNSFLLRCWQMGWLDRYDQIKTIELISDTDGLITKRMAIEALNTEIMTKRLNGEEGTLDEFDTEEIIRKLMPMPSNTSNALKALNSVNATQFNALDSISRQAAINALETTKRIANHELHSGEVLRTFNIVLNSLINIMSLLPQTQPEHILHCKDCKYFKQVFAPNDNDGLCGHWHSKCDARTSQEGYCSHAERKQE